MIGVYYKEKSNTYMAKVYVNKEDIYIGTYKTEAEAGQARANYIIKNNITLRSYKSSIKITYTCEKDGCNNQKTVDTYVYNRAKTHYCSKKCYYSSRIGIKIGNRPINPDNHITFTCENKGCDNIRTTPKSLYNNAKHHYCSMQCSGENKGWNKRNINEETIMFKYNKKFKQYFKEQNNE